MRTEIETDEDSQEGDKDSLTADARHYSDTQVQERLLNQMLARRRNIEVEEKKALEMGKLIRPDVYTERPFLKELMMDIVHKRRRNDE